MDAQDNYLKSVTNKVRSTWITEKQRYLSQHSTKIVNYKPGPALDGGTDCYGRKYQPIWPKLAQFVISNKLDPAKFVKAQFESCKGKPPVSPNVLMSQLAITRYINYVAKNSDEEAIKIALDSQTRSAMNAVDWYTLLYGPGTPAYRAVIIDTSLPLSALFRYSLAVSSGQDDLQRAIFDVAVEQYMCDREAYDQIWKDLITDDVKKTADLLERSQLEFYRDAEVTPK